MKFKDYLYLRKKRKQEEKELEKKMKEEEKEIDSELPNDVPMSVNEFLDQLKEDTDEEYKSYLTPEELKEEVEREKESKKIGIIAGIVFLITIVLVWIGSTIYYNLNKADIYKITQPLMEEYYENRYGEKVNITSIEELTYQVKDENDKYQTVNTGIYLAETDNNKHIMSVNNAELGDDISISSLNQEFLDYMTSNLPNTNIITQSVELSYKPYYMEFNRYIEYINSLPAGKTLDEMFEDQSLTATYKIVYQDYLDLDVINDMMSKLSDDSSIYALELEVGLPKSLIVIKKDIFYQLPVANATQKDDNIFYYSFTADTNTTTSVDISYVAGSSIESLDDYTFNDGYMFEFENRRQKRDEVKLPSYFLLRFSNGIINPSTVKQVNTSTGSHRELDIKDYDDLIYIEAGGYVYYIGDVDEFLIANNGEKKSGLCKIGICF